MSGPPRPMSLARGELEECATCTSGRCSIRRARSSRTARRATSRRPCARRRCSPAPPRNTRRSRTQSLSRSTSMSTAVSGRLMPYDRPSNCCGERAAAASGNAPAPRDSIAWPPSRRPRAGSRRDCPPAARGRRRTPVPRAGSAGTLRCRCSKKRSWICENSLLPRFSDEREIRLDLREVIVVLARSRATSSCRRSARRAMSGRSISAAWRRELVRNPVNRKFCGSAPRVAVAGQAGQHEQESQAHRVTRFRRRKKTPRRCAAFCRTVLKQSLTSRSSDGTCGRSSRWSHRSRTATPAPRPAPGWQRSAHRSRSTKPTEQRHSRHQRSSWRQRGRPVRRLTCCLRLSTSACRGFKSWQPANTVNAATAATLIIALFITINPLIGG